MTSLQSNERPGRAKLSTVAGFFGLRLEVWDDDERLWARRAGVGAAIWAASLIGVQLAGFAGRVGLFQFGATLGLLGVGLQIGLFLGRSTVIRTMVVASTGVVAILLLSFAALTAGGLYYASPAAAQDDLLTQICDSLDMSFYSNRGCNRGEGGYYDSGDYVSDVLVTPGDEPIDIGEEGWVYELSGYWTVEFNRCGFGGTAANYETRGEAISGANSIDAALAQICRDSGQGSSNEEQTDLGSDSAGSTTSTGGSRSTDDEVPVGPLVAAGVVVAAGAGAAVLTRARRRPRPSTVGSTPPATPPLAPTGGTFEPLPDAGAPDAPVSDAEVPGSDGTFEPLPDSGVADTGVPGSRVAVDPPQPSGVPQGDPEASEPPEPEQVARNVPLVEEDNLPGEEKAPGEQSPSGGNQAPQSGQTRVTSTSALADAGSAAGSSEGRFGGSNAGSSGGAGDNPSVEFDSGSFCPMPAAGQYGWPTHAVNTLTRRLSVIDNLYGFATAGPGIELAINYNTPSTQGAMFGDQWRFSYESLVAEVGESLLWVRGSGQVVALEDRDGAIVAPGHAAAIHVEGREVIIDSDGVVARYDLAAGGRLTSISNRGGVLVLSYDGDRLSSLTDPAGRSVSFSYEKGRCNLIELPSGQRLTFVYRGDRLLRCVDALGIVTEYMWRGDLLTSMSVDSGKRTTSFTYDGDEVAAVVSPAGAVTRYERMDGERVRVNYPDGTQVVFTGRNGQTVAIDDAQGAPLTRELQPNEYVERLGTQSLRTRRNADGDYTITENDNRTTRFQTEDESSIVITDPTGARTVLELHKANGLTTWRSRVGDGYGAEVVRDGSGRVAGTSDHYGQRTDLDYDEYGNVVAVRSPQGVLRHEYDEAGIERVATIDQLGRRWRYSFDANRRLVGIENPDGSTTAWRYGCCAVEEITADGTSVRHQRDADLNIDVTDVGGLRTVHRRDLTDRRLEVIEPSGRTVEVVESSNGRSREWRHSDGTTETFVDDADGLSFTDRVGGTHRYLKDAHGDLIAEIDGAGRRMDYERDGAGRLLGWRRGDRRATIQIDQAGLIERVTAGQDGRTFTSDKAGNVVVATTTDTTTTITRGSDGIIDSIVYDGAETVEFEHDRVGRVNGIVQPTGRRLAIDHDAGDRIERVSFAGNWITMEYNAAGRLVREERSNGTSTTYRRSARGAIIGVQHYLGDRSLAEIAYERDHLDRVIAMEDSRDVAGELSIESVDLRFDRSSAVISVGGVRADLDASGAVREVPGLWRLTHDGFGNLVASQSDEHSTSAVFDGFGRRRSHEVDGVAIRELRDLDGVLRYSSAQGGMDHIYAHGLVALATADDVWWLHFDATGNTVLVTNASGQPVASASYGPFEVLDYAGDAALARYRYGARHGVIDDGEGFLLMGARHYYAPWGRFLQPDPIGHAGGSNRYRYASNDPLHVHDPTGHAGRWFEQYLPNTLQRVTRDLGLVNENMSHQRQGRPGRSDLMEQIQQRTGPLFDSLAERVREAGKDIGELVDFVVSGVGLAGGPAAATWAARESARGVREAAEADSPDEAALILAGRHATRAAAIVYKCGGAPKTDLRNPFESGGRWRTALNPSGGGLPKFRGQ